MTQLINVVAMLAALYIVFRVIDMAWMFVSNSGWCGPLWRYYGLTTSLATILAGAGAALLGYGFALHLLLIGAAGLLFSDQRHCGTGRRAQRSPG
jgi:hypothetical protein